MAFSKGKRTFTWRPLCVGCEGQKLHGLLLIRSCDSFVCVQAVLLKQQPDIQTPLLRSGDDFFSFLSIFPFPFPFSFFSFISFSFLGLSSVCLSFLSSFPCPCFFFSISISFHFPSLFLVKPKTKQSLSECTFSLSCSCPLQQLQSAQRWPSPLQTLERSPEISPFREREPQEM